MRLHCIEMNTSDGFALSLNAVYIQLLEQLVPKGITLILNLIVLATLKIKLYYSPLCAHSRAILLFCLMTNIEVDPIEVDIFTQDAIPGIPDNKIPSIDAIATTKTDR